MNTNSSPCHTSKILIVAGEASGDLHGANLVKAMHAIDPALRFYGIAGKNMQAAGVEIIADSADMAVMGFTEVIGKIRYIMQVKARLKLFLKQEKPALLIVIDYPGFNIPLAGMAKKSGIPVFYYISPKVWAWRRGRIKTIRRIVDTIAVILPFEEQMYREAGVHAHFVGHPLLDTVKTKYTKDDAIKKFALQENVTTIGLLPGSRKSEVAALLPEMLKSAFILKKKLHTVQFVLPLADTLTAEFVGAIIRQHPVDVHLIKNDTYDVINLSDVAVVASGTATLETALLEKPMIIVYKVSRLSYLIGRAVIKVKHIGLANIIAGETIVPEFIQGEANAERIAAEVIDILTREGRMAHIKSALADIRGKLGAPGASDRAAKLAYGIIQRT
ncbi:MAG: lipid-A-disaccharide synthase [Deltaproteobacteria bacterium]|nr:lipid-A-disaccharide synthase [Deltaproteobacteria bacterium]